MLTDTVLLAAAAFAALRLWFRGGVFAVAREYCKAYRNAPGRLRRGLGTLLLCPLCLSPYVAAALAALFLAPACLLPEPWSSLARLPLCALAAAALVPLKPLSEEHDVPTESYDDATACPRCRASINLTGPRDPGPEHCPKCGCKLRGKNENPREDTKILPAQ